MNYSSLTPGPINYLRSSGTVLFKDWILGGVGQYRRRWKSSAGVTWAVPIFLESLTGVGRAAGAAGVGGAAGAAWTVRAEAGAQARGEAGKP